MPCGSPYRRNLPSRPMMVASMNFSRLRSRPASSRSFMSDPDPEKVRVLGELRQVALPPHPALRVDVLRANPGRQLGLLALELRRVAQAERPIDEQRGAEPEAV